MLSFWGVAVTNYILTKIIRVWSEFMMCNRYHSIFFLVKFTFSLAQNECDFQCMYFEKLVRFFLENSFFSFGLQRQVFLDYYNKIVIIGEAI